MWQRCQPGQALSREVDGVDVELLRREAFGRDGGDRSKHRRLARSCATEDKDRAGAVEVEGVPVLSLVSGIVAAGDRNDDSALSVGFAEAVKNVANGKQRIQFR